MRLWSGRCIYTQGMQVRLTYTPHFFTGTNKHRPSAHNTGHGISTTYTLVLALIAQFSVAVSTVSGSHCSTSPAGTELLPLLTKLRYAFTPEDVYTYEWDVLSRILLRRFPSSFLATNESLDKKGHVCLISFLIRLSADSGYIVSTYPYTSYQLKARERFSVSGWRDIKA
ncbi:hypothetical protein F4814DRAFT_115879 [Daldinia grandis]|nr:hypothetical protein F4814DRAFT_115879 [Daldinia grandis]